MSGDDSSIENHRKAEMTLSTRHAPFLASLALAALASPCAAADHGSQFVTNATRCQAYGPDYTAVEGSDVCARIGGHVRVQLGTSAGLHPDSGWGAGRASSATLRSSGGGERTAATPSHLRVQGGLESPNPFR